MSDETPKYSFHSPRHQSFSFPPDVIKFIQNNCSSSDIFQTLQQTCKYFFNKKKIIILDVRVISNQFVFKMPWNHNYKTYRSFSGSFKYWLTNILLIRDSDLNYGGITNFLKSIYRCNLKKLVIRHESLTFKEMEFLLNGGEIQQLNLHAVNIQDEDGTSVTLDSILAKCPNIREVIYHNKSETFSTKTFFDLNQLKFAKKMEKFVLILSKIEGQIDPNIFCEFLKNKLTKSAQPRFYFPSDFKEQNLESFYSKVQSILENYFCKLIMDLSVV